MNTRPSRAVAIYDNAIKAALISDSLCASGEKNAGRFPDGEAAAGQPAGNGFGFSSSFFHVGKRGHFLWRVLAVGQQRRAVAAAGGGGGGGGGL